MHCNTSLTITVFAIFTLLLSSCSSEEVPVGATTSLIDTLEQDALVLDTGEVRIFTLPAPLQIPTSLNLLNASFEAKLMANNTNARQFSGQVKKGENLGLSIVDLGYCAMNQQNQLCLEKLEFIATLTEDLGVTSSFDGEAMARFKANQEDVDSMSWLILDAYDKAHNYFRENDKEALGLAILSGCLIEGIYISAYYQQLSNKSEYYALFSQQKTYLENTILLLSRFTDDPEYNALREDLRFIYRAFDAVEGDVVTTSKAIVIPENFAAAISTIYASSGTVRDRIMAQ